MSNSNLFIIVGMKTMIKYKLQTNSTKNYMFTNIKFKNIFYYLINIMLTNL